MKQTGQCLAVWRVVRLCLALLVSGCGGDGGSDMPVTPPPPAPADGVVLQGRLYTVTRLNLSGLTGFAVSDLPSVSVSFSDLNNHGQLIGTAPLSDASVCGFLFNQGLLTRLPSCSHENVPTDINDAGQIVGTCRGAGVLPGPARGFLQDGSRFVTLDVPGPMQLSQNTAVSGINNAGQIVGSYSPFMALFSRDSSHGFLLDSGTFTTIDVPGARSTFADAINNTRQIVGFFVDINDVSHGFLWEQGRLTIIDIPGATRVFGWKINTAGQTIGSFEDANGVSHGFLWEQGRLTVIDAPEATWTFASAINTSGQIVGSFKEVHGDGHGFLWEQGRLVPIDIAGSNNTIAVAINDRGQILGSLTHATGRSAYVATPVDSGHFTHFESN